MDSHRNGHWSIPHLPSSEYIFHRQGNQTLWINYVHNDYFPCALLHGSTLLGGIGIPTPTHKATKETIDYFFFNVCHSSPIRDKLEASLIFTQLEIGTFQHFFTSLFSHYSRLATTSLGVQSCRETQPCGIELRSVDGESWSTIPSSPNDIALMDIATQKNNMRGSTMINRCRLNLLAISFMDLLTYDLKHIHPSYLSRNRLSSQAPTIFWPDFLNPPKHYWKLWPHFIKFHITPLLQLTNLTWDPHHKPCHTITFPKDRHLFHYIMCKMRKSQNFACYTAVEHIVP